MTPEQEEKYKRLRGELAVHLQALHEDGQQQPCNACEAGELAAELRAMAKRLAIAVSEAEATGARTIRENPSAYGLKDKPAEAAVESAVNLLPDVQAARRAYIDADAESGKAASLADAYEHRKAMLRMEAELWVNSYWGDVAVNERQMSRVVGAGDSQRADRLERRYAEARQAGRERVGQQWTALQKAAAENDGVK